MSTVPRIAINGRFLTQRASGVQRFATEAIKAIDALLDRDYAVLKGRIEFIAPSKARLSAAGKERARHLTWGSTARNLLDHCLALGDKRAA